MSKIQKTEKEGIYRDMTNNALLNKDNNSLNAYKKQKEKFNEIDKLKSEISEIKEMLTLLLEKNK